MEEHENCRYRFFKWIVRMALRHRRIYWLLWGLIAVLFAVGVNIKELW